MDKIKNETFNDEMINERTEKLIKNLKLKPAPNESIYSQSFMDRERKIVRRLKNKSNEKILVISSKQEVKYK